MEHSYYMNEALKEANKAYDKNETPIGAIIVKDNVIISRAHNLRETLKDPTAHAEILAIKEAANILGGWRLVNCTMYITMEPCIMCTGAIIESRIKKVVIGTKHIKGKNSENNLNQKIDYFNNNNIEITLGILEEQCSNILKKFFKDLRRK
jgi:tRNA(adenine34) deaminase